VSRPLDPELAQRYEGRPLLILLENYVLACIGALTAEHTVRVADLTRRAFGAPSGADWMEVLRTQLDLAPTICDSIRERWQVAVTTLQAEGEPIDPVAFARGLVDANFAQYIDRLSSA
jgi:hypothetical protein